MKICILSEHFFPLVGGTSVYTYEITKNIAEFNLKDEIYLLTISSNNISNEFKIKKSNLHFIQIKLPKFLQKERYVSIFLSLRLLKLCLQQKIDLIHVSYGFFSIFYATLIAKLLRKKIIFTIQNVPPEEHSILKNTLFQIIYNKILRLFSYLTLNLPFNKVICVSNHTAFLAQSRGVKQDKIVVIPNGINDLILETHDKNKGRIELGLTSNELILLNVAGIIKHKGQHILLEAFLQICNEIPNSSLIFIGPIRDFNYYRQLIKIIKAKGKSNKILVLGEKNYFDMPKYYSMANIYIQSSLQEGFCISILEAMGSGTPVIGTNVGAISRFIGNNERGLLIKNLTPENLRDAILKLIQNPNLANEFALKGADFVKTNYNWKDIAKKTHNLYKSII